MPPVGTGVKGEHLCFHPDANDRLLRAILLTCFLLLPGTPYVVSAEAARDGLARLSQLQQRSRHASDDTQERTGAPPAVDELRTLSQTPPLSGANPPYPRNHVLDGLQADLGTPPSNHSFESAPTTTGTPASNHDLETSPTAVGTQATNHDFETGDFTGWTTSGTTTIETNANQGDYAKLTGTGAEIVSSAFTVDSATQAFTVEVGWLTNPGYSWIQIYVLSGTGYTTETTIADTYCNNCGTWETLSFDASSWIGQSVKLKLKRRFGDVGVNDVQMTALFPTMTTSGSFNRVDESGDHVAKLVWGATLTTEALTLASDAQMGSIAVKGLTQFADQVQVDVLSGAGYATVTTVLGEIVPDSWTTLQFMLAAWAGESVKLRVKAAYQNVLVDDIGIQIVELPGWLVESDTEGDPEIERIDNAGDHSLRLATGSVTTAAFTLDAEAQQLQFSYRAGSASSQFDVELLHGTNHSQVTQLDTTVQTSDQVNWQTFLVAIDDFAGESVKLRIDQGFGWGEYDLVGLSESILPGWHIAGDDPVLFGEDAGGSYLTGRLAANGDGNFVVESSLISPGIIDRPFVVDQRYYAIAYDIGYRTGALIRVTWHEEGTSNNWIVYQHASNSPTGYVVDYFWLSDFTGTSGHFEVEVADDAGKFYSLADNIARVQLSEPFSEQVGFNIDTSTGAFGYQENDIRTAGRLPLSFTRFYNGHSDHYGVMGYRWTHTYDIRLEVLDNDDAGVVFGSGQEIFFDWYTVVNDPPNRYIPADPRNHDTLVENQDGTYTYTTRTNLAYLFDANGELQSITDLNGNQITLTYNGSGQLMTITGLGAQVISLTYDGNGRLSTVTDPESEVWIYAYDANGDLTSVTVPDLSAWQYEYDRHRLTAAINPLGDVIFENTFDDWHRVIEQKDADLNTLTIDYDTPGLGATEVTDPENNTATFYFDQYQRTTDMVDPLGNTITRGYDADGNLDEIIDADFNQWSFNYNASGDLVSLLNPLGQSTQYTYNNEHLPTTTTDARNNTTTYTYDGNGNVLTQTDPLNNTWTFTYDTSGNRLTETDPLNNITTFTYDAAGNVLTETDPLNNTWSWTYDNFGRVLTQTDPLNNTSTYTYDIFGRLASATDPLGKSMEYIHDPWGKLYRVTDRAGNQTNWTYNDVGNVVSMTDEAGKLWTYSYDANGNPSTETNPLNKVTSYSWDDKNRLVAITDPLNNTTSYTYDANDQLISETDPLNRTTSYTYDDAGRLSSRTMPNTGVWSYTYDANGNLLTQTDPLNNTTSYTYDANNQLLTVTDARNNTTTYSYDAAGRRIAVTDPLNNTTDYGYDAAGQLTSITDPLNNTTAYNYDDAGRRTGLTDALNNTWTFGYDGMGQRTTTTDPLNNQTTTSYDANGRISQVVRPSSATTAYTYDPRGLMLTIVDPLNNTTSYGYDDAGQRTSMTDRRNNTTSYTYDDAGRMTAMTDALSGVVGFGYDAAGQRTSLTNPNNQTTTYTYDANGDLLTQTDPLNRTTTYTYDLAGMPTGMTDARSVSVSYGYDANGNRTSTTYPSGSITAVFDANNRRTSMTDSTGQTTWSYDAAGQVTAVAAPNGTVSYTYDAAGQRATMTLPGSRTYTYAHDAAGRTSSIVDWLSQTIAFGYDVDGRRTSITRQNGVTSTYTYDAADQITALDHSGAGCQCSLQSYGYTYDAEGNRTSMTTAAGTESYTLDALNRLTNVTYANNDTDVFTYDASGNLLTHTFNGNLVATYTYDAGGQLTSDGTLTYTHDAAGNMTGAGADAFTWDWANQLTSATVGGTTESYTYDGEGTRTSATTGGVTTPYLWDHEGSVEYLVDDGANVYLHQQGLLSETDGNNVTSYHLADGLGSVRGLTDPNENLIGTATFDAFGSFRSQTGTTSVFGFAGEQHDAATGNQYLRARYFAPVIGRFLSVDTVQPNAPGTQGFNLYAYVANNPTTWVDPTGNLAIAHPLAWAIILVFVIVILCLTRVICPLPDNMAFPGDYSPSLSNPPFGKPSDWSLPSLPPGLTPVVPPAFGNTPIDGAFYSSTNQMNTEIKRGQAPNSIDRVDHDESQREGSERDPCKDHVHFKDGMVINRDGSRSHESRGWRPLTNKEKKWLDKHDWGSC